LSLEIDLQIALEHGLFSLAGILYVSSSPCNEDKFRRVLGRVRKDADIAAHYARRYLESGGPVPPRSIFEEIEALLIERETAETSSWTGKLSTAPASYPPIFPKALTTLFCREVLGPSPVRDQAAPPGSTQDLARALRLVIQGLYLFRKITQLKYFLRCEP